MIYQDQADQRAAFRLYKALTAPLPSPEPEAEPVPLQTHSHGVLTDILDSRAPKCDQELWEKT